MTVNRQVVLARDCEATTVPGGSQYFLRAGSTIRLTQALGGSYTVMNDSGYILRIEAKDADALGLEHTPAEETKPAEFSEKLVWDELKTVYDPEIPVNVVDLGLIYSCDIAPVSESNADGHKLDIKMTMTAPGCGMGGILKADIERRLEKLPTVKQVNVEIVLDPPWHPGKMSEAARLQLGLDLENSPLPMYGRD